MSDNPYRDAGTPLNSGNPKASSSPSFWQYRPLAMLCMLATIGMTVQVGMLMFMAGLELFGEIMFPGFTDPNRLMERGLEESIVYTQVGISVLAVLVYLFNGVIICMFMYRASANVRSFGATGLKNNPGWCCGYWFIPILNYFKPFQCMKEIHKASSNPDGNKWHSAASHPLMGFWWGCWLIATVASDIETRLVWRGIDLGIGGIVLDWAVTLLLAAAAFSLILILRSITSLQSNPGSQSPEKFGPVE